MRLLVIMLVVLGPAVARAGECDAKPAVKVTAAEQQAADWAVAQIRAAGSVEKAMRGAKVKEFLARGGFDARALDIEHVKAAVETGLAAGGCELSMNRCSMYGACAIGTDLTEATGALLAKYKQQKAEDGQTFKGRAAPAFKLKDLDGRTVALADFQGRRVALVFWQSHCSHSMQSLPAWDQLSRELKSRGLSVVTVLFNGGDAQYVKSWYGPMGYRLPVLLAPDETLADAYGSRLVPSVFLIDERGQLAKKLVTQKTPDELRRELTAFVRS